jgi:anion transporter
MAAHAMISSQTAARAAVTKPAGRAPPANTHAMAAAAPRMDFGARAAYLGGSALRSRAQGANKAGRASRFAVYAAEDLGSAEAALVAAEAEVSKAKAAVDSAKLAAQTPEEKAELAAKAEAAKAAKAKFFRSDTGAGAEVKPLLISLMCGLVIWFIPPPAAVAIKAWKLLAIFVGTIVAIITTPLPLGAVAMMGLGVCMLTKVLPFSAAFSAFSSEIPWLIAIAFFLAKGFIKTGLGSRIAYLIVRAFGKTTLGLTYSLVGAEALLAPAIPSLGARAGGIFLPIAKALCKSCGSDPANGTQNKMGAYMMFVVFQSSTISSGMFITAMAANPLTVNLAAATIGHTITWGQWALAALVPGIICLLGAPYITYLLFPPEVKETPDAPKLAAAELEKMGPMSVDEKIMSAALLVTVALWIGGSALGIGGVAAALLGLTVLLVTGVISWKECLGEAGAWDTLTWFAALIAMADYLNKYGLIKWFSAQVVTFVNGLGLAWQPAGLIVVLIYFYSHYFFASGAAHIGAMYTAFLSVLVACGAPAVPSAILLGILSNTMGCLTHYGIGSAPPFFAQGYVELATWWKLGFILSVFYLSVYLGIGPVWWKVIGLM